MLLRIDTEAGTISAACPQFGYARGGYVMNLSHLFLISGGMQPRGRVRIPGLGVVVTKAPVPYAVVNGELLMEKRVVQSITLEAL